MSEYQDIANTPRAGHAGAVLGSLIAGTLDTLISYLDATPLTGRTIHLARRDAKRLRALALLVPEPLMTLGIRTGDCVNQARRALGGARDADVRQEMLERLQCHLGGYYAELAAVLGRDQQERPSQGSLHAYRKALNDIAREWRDADTHVMQVRDIVAAAASGYRKARKRAAKTGDGETQALHRLRSAVVNHQNQLEFLSRLVPGLTAQAESAHDLRKQLGNINDLDMTCAYLRPLLSQGPALAVLQNAALEHRQKYLEKARILIAQVLATGTSHWEQNLRRAFGQYI